jgi:hypothetical protein
LKDLSVDFSDNTMPLRQVIVNTHSPIVVGHLFNWKEDKNVSIWYADIIDRIVTLNRKRSNLSATKILPVVKDDNSQLQFLFSEVEKKVTLKTVQHYLKTADFNRA